MSKKLLAGILLGGAATYAAWKKMAPAKKEALKESVDEKINKVADYVTDYTLDALDIVDDLMSDSNLNDKVSGAADAVNNVKGKVKDSASKVVNHMTNDDFDKQTADIREELAKNKEADEDNNDIIIDATSDQKPVSTEDDEAGQDDAKTADK
ncbi:cytochrome P450 [Limosilactobacillus balticus]|uniref:cytochrome P450 n=1 Tax=Limosilactobacillus balticus TaxID=2759747 RepID=UPI001E512811|nr:cytochrome P450 [Limosilactobacillus balticus]MCD7132244.1 cytochrome P450 [Limosilactobacillus balticus]